MNHLMMQLSWRQKTILFLISQSITLFGSTLVQMAMIWYVTLATFSGAWVAVFGPLADVVPLQGIMACSGAGLVFLAGFVGLKMGGSRENKK